MRPRFLAVSVLFVLLSGASMMTVLAQSVTVARIDNAIAVRAPAFDFITGDPLDRLKDGRTVRVELVLDVLPGPGGSAAAEGRRTFLLSYDLWEERFAVAEDGAPSRSVAYLTSAAAEDWCLEHLTVPVTALGDLARDRPFWIRLTSRVAEADGAARDDGAPFTLRGLIDALSLRRRSAAPAQSIEAGPFRLPQ